MSSLQAPSPYCAHEPRPQERPRVVEADSNVGRQPSGDCCDLVSSPVPLALRARTLTIIALRRDRDRDYHDSSSRVNDSAEEHAVEDLEVLSLGGTDIV